MKYSKKITLKDGRECLLRNGEEKDGEAALENFTRTHEQTDFMLGYPDEIKFTAEEEGKYLAKKTASDKEIEIIAEVDGKLVGLAGIEKTGDFFKLSHRAEFGVSVDKDYWKLGIGRALTEACIECAREAGYTLLELNAVAENTAALSLYKSVGFVEYGRHPRGFKTRPDGYQEVIYMYLEL